MKKIIFILAIILSVNSFNTANAQVNVNINIGNQPAWGPSGYDYAGYYYFPDLNIYFDVTNSLFYYLSGSKWISNQYLPNKYSKYDFYNMYKVVVNEKQPWLQNKTHKKEYSNYKGNKTQISIRNTSDTKYNQSRNNTRSWVDNNQVSNNKNQKQNSTKQNNTKNSNNDRQSSNNQSKSNNRR